jgi:glucose-1-phosphatase
VTLPVSAVVFDLAGVLLDFQGAESIARLSDGRVSAADFSRFWTTPLSDAFYTGDCSADEFAAGAVEAFGLKIDPGAFLHDFRTWLRGPYEGAFELVAAVRTRAVVACLSNTNSLDVSRFRSELALHRGFDYCFFSNEIRLRKPARECYSHVLEVLGFPTAPKRVVFFDDSTDCVQGALAVGMRAYQAAGVPAVLGHLQALGVLNV